MNIGQVDDNDNILSSDDDNENSEDEEDGSDAESSSDGDDEEYLDPGIFDDDYFSDLLKNIAKKLTDESPSILGIPCIAHNFHLVVTHAIQKSTQTKNCVGNCRFLAKKLRSPNMRRLLKEKQKEMEKEKRPKIALLDVETRWSSTYYMVNLP